jgi:aspartokinase/homoserine dehydrogenase 1
MGSLRPRVLKFGGTSVGSPASLRSAIAIAGAAATEAPLVLVVSALSGVTDALEAAVLGAALGRLDASGFSAALRRRHLALLGTVAASGPAARAERRVLRLTADLQDRLEALARGRTATPAIRAALLAVGERLSAPVVAAGLEARGLDSRPVDAASLIRTDDRFEEATVDAVATRRLVREAFSSLGRGVVPVVTGFVGGTIDGATTLLGRGGSDLTAAVLGGALEAERVEIWSDVDGVMDADPRLVEDVRTLPRLSYAEAVALARAGAKVLHPRTLEPLEDARIPLYVGNTLRPDGPGTWIGPGGASGEEGRAA